MGSDFSIQENTAKEICDIFLKQFQENYAAARLTTYVKHSVQNNAVQWKLTKCVHPPPPPIIKTGVLHKRSEHLKKWNPRFVVVRGNYLIDYYESEEKFKAGEKKIHSIDMSNKKLYRDATQSVFDRHVEHTRKHNVHDETPQETFPPYTMEIWHDRKPAAYLHAADEKDWGEWCAVLEKCSECAPRLHHTEDRLHMFAFRKALARTLGMAVCDISSWGGGEESQLNDAIHQKISDVPDLCNIRQKFVQVIDQFVTTNVQRTWEGTWRNVTPPPKDKVNSCMQAIVDVQKHIQVKAEVKVSVEQIMDATILPHLGSLLNAVASPVIESFRCIIRAFDAALDMDPQRYKPQKDCLCMVNIHMKSRDFMEAESWIWNLYDPLLVMKLTFPNISPWAIAHRIQQRLRKLLNNALFNFENLLVAGKEWSAAAKDTKQHLKEDCDIAIARALNRLCLDVAEKTFQEHVILCVRMNMKSSLDLDVVKPLEALVDLDDILEDFLWSTLKSKCADMVARINLDLTVEADAAMEKSRRELKFMTAALEDVDQCFRCPGAVTPAMVQHLSLTRFSVRYLDYKATAERALSIMSTSFCIDCFSPLSAVSKTLAFLKDVVCQPFGPLIGTLGTICGLGAAAVANKQAIIHLCRQLLSIRHVLTNLYVSHSQNPNAITPVVREIEEVFNHARLLIEKFGATTSMCSAERTSSG